MLGSIIGDIVGSIYEFDNIKTKDFPFFGGDDPSAPPTFSEKLTFTDDTVMTVATADWLLSGGDIGRHYAEYGINYRGRGYGGSFRRWLRHFGMKGEVAAPYNSCGNGSGMRVGPVGWAFENEEEVLAAAETTAACTHNHPEGIKGAQAVALSVFLARRGATPSEIRRAISEKFGYDLTLSVDEIRPRYSWNGMDKTGNSEICQDSVPQAIVCALEARDFEDAVRNAISLGGDSDTIACMAGAIAEPLFGIPEGMQIQALTYLDERMIDVIDTFEARFGHR